MLDSTVKRCGITFVVLELIDLPKWTIPVQQLSSLLTDEIPELGLSAGGWEVDYFEVIGDIEIRIVFP